MTYKYEKYIGWVGYKECTKCHQILPVSAFHKYSFGKKGPRAECIECERLRNSLYRQKKLIENGPDYLRRANKKSYYKRKNK